MNAWDCCEVRYRVRNREAAHDLTLCDEMPPGWVLSREEPISIDGYQRRGSGYDLVFEVQGEPRERDGVIVRRIIQRLGML